MRVETRKTLSSFVIEGAEKEDEGRYSITVNNPAGEDKAELVVHIVGQWLFLLLSPPTFVFLQLVQSLPSLQQRLDGL